VVLLDAQFVDIIIAVQNGKPEPPWLVGAFLGHDLHIVHLPELLNDDQDVLLRGVRREPSKKDLLCPLVGLRVLLLSRDGTLAFNLTSGTGDGREAKKILI
jgi:hypothetical protein